MPKMKKPIGGADPFGRGDYLLIAVIIGSLVLLGYAFNKKNERGTVACPSSIISIKQGSQQ